MNRKILYIHGLSSSGKSGTATTLQQLLPNMTVIAPDLPINPHAALELLNTICRENRPNVIIGTLTGGMFAQQMRGFAKIIVNPAFHVSEFMQLHLGKQPFLNKREDGVQEYEITTELCNSYLQVEKTQFEDINDWEVAHTCGLFGMNDSLVNCQEEFLQHYKQAIRFEGEHRLTFEDVKDVVVPLVKEIIKKSTD